MYLFFPYSFHCSTTSCRLHFIFHFPFIFSNFPSMISWITCLAVRFRFYEWMDSWLVYVFAHWHIFDPCQPCNVITKEAMNRGTPARPLSLTISTRDRKVCSVCIDECMMNGWRSLGCYTFFVYFYQSLFRHRLEIWLKTILSDDSKWIGWWLFP